MMMKKLMLAATALAMVALVAGCGDDKKAAPPKASDVYRAPKIDTAGLLAKAKDGTYKEKAMTNGASGETGDDSYTILTLTIKNHKITDAKYVGYLKDGKVKDTEYGKTHGKAENKVYYNKAQLAVNANKTFAEKLVKTQQMNKVDAISGATYSYKAFMEAGQHALEKAAKK